MKVIFKFAVRIYNIYNPMVGLALPKRKNADIQLLDKAEQGKLQSYIAKNQNLGTLGTALSYSTGIRIGELCALQWKDIDLEKRILTVSKTMQRIQCKHGANKTKLIITDPKSDSSKRTIPIPECMMSFLYKFKGKANEFVVSGSETPVEPRTMQYRFSKILKNAKLPSVHFHALRHIFASTCVKLGFDIKNMQTEIAENIHAFASEYVTDIISALTHNDTAFIRTYTENAVQTSPSDPFYYEKMEGAGMSGHSNMYWDDGPYLSQQKEVFANLFAVRVENNPIVQEFIKEHFPGLTHIFDEIVKQLNIHTF